MSGVAGFEIILHMFRKNFYDTCHKLLTKLRGFAMQVVCEFLRGSLRTYVNLPRNHCRLYAETLLGICVTSIQYLRNVLLKGCRKHSKEITQHFLLTKSTYVLLRKHNPRGNGRTVRRLVIQRFSVESVNSRVIRLTSNAHLLLVQRRLQVQKLPKMVQRTHKTRFRRLNNLRTPKDRSEDPRKMILWAHCRPSVELPNTFQ